MSQEANKSKEAQTKLWPKLLKRDSQESTNVPGL